jgi:hypothetical protein
MQTSCLFSTFIVLFHILGPKSDTLRLYPRQRSNNGSDLRLFFKGLLKKETEYVNSIYIKTKSIFSQKN